jgi:drug/metabolite transporter (DMT)-like permease
MVAAIGFFFFAQVPDIWTGVGAVIIFAATYYSARREAKIHRARTAAD